MARQYPDYYALRLPAGMRQRAYDVADAMDVGHAEFFRNMVRRGIVAAEQRIKREREGVTS